MAHFSAGGRTKRRTSNFKVRRSDPAELRPSDATLVLLTGAHAGRTYKVRDKLVIGRSPGCEAIVQGTGVSREHAQITLNPITKSYMLRDLGWRPHTAS